MRFNRALLLVPLIAACATPEGAYPSLALREAERVTGSLEPAPPAPFDPPPTSATVLDELDRLAAAAASAHQRFLGEAPAARRAVAAAGNAELGSDGWARASVAVADLESARSQAMIALADLDRLMVEAATQGTALERIVTVRSAVIAQVDEQNATIDSFLETLR